MFTKHLGINFQSAFKMGTQLRASRRSSSYIWMLSLAPKIKLNFSMVSQHPILPRVVHQLTFKLGEQSLHFAAVRPPTTTDRGTTHPQGLKFPHQWNGDNTYYINSYMKTNPYNSVSHQQSLNKQYLRSAVLAERLWASHSLSRLQSGYRSPFLLASLLRQSNQFMLENVPVPQGCVVSPCWLRGIRERLKRF